MRPISWSMEQHTPVGHPGKDGVDSVGIETLADFLFPLFKPHLRAELEAYRVEWERLHGPTDLTRYYTSMWPVEARSFLWKTDPKRYFDGLPPFAQDWLRDKMELAAADGSLDDVGDTCLRLYTRGHMGSGRRPHG